LGLSVEFDEMGDGYGVVIHIRQEALLINERDKSSLMEGGACFELVIGHRWGIAVFDVLDPDDGGDFIQVYRIMVGL
jgi:hypothetical protein